MINDVNAKPTGLYALAVSLDPQVQLGHAPIKTFDGSFEGLGHLISSLSLRTGAQYARLGLFANSSGTIRDLNLDQISIKGPVDGYIGALVGQSSGMLIGNSINANVTGQHGAYIGALAGYSGGSVSRCSTSGHVVGIPDLGVDLTYVGGLIGSSAGDVEYSNSSATVRGGEAGGLVGGFGGTVNHSFATGAVGDNTTGDAGGLVGFAGSGTISASYASGDVVSEGRAGGLVSLNGAAIKLSFATGSVSVSNAEFPYLEAGGLVGESSGGGSIQDSYSLGSAKTDGSQADAGGLVGNNRSAITSVYSTGMPSAVQKDGSHVGGFAGEDIGSITNGYWDLDTSGISNRRHGAGNRLHDPGIKGLTDAELKAGLPKGFASAIWGQKKSINNGYPYLLANPPLQ
jgi:hypothetical protein